VKDFLILAVLAALAAVGIVSTVRHFRAKGGCCGGGRCRVKRKKLKTVLYTKTFRVEGMHCEHCRRRVEEAVNDIHGAAASVHLRRGELTVCYGEEIPDSRIREKAEKAGYRIP